jgi:hypothetical protein
MLEGMPRTLRQALSSRATRRIDGAGRLMAFLALVGAVMIAAALVLAVRGSSWALTVGVAGAVVQAGGFLGAFWWATRHPPPRCDRGRS